MPKNLINLLGSYKADTCDYLAIKISISMGLPYSGLQRSHFGGRTGNRYQSI